jgi:hypothetical protein
MIPTPSMPDCTSATSAWSCGTLGSKCRCLWLYVLSLLLVPCVCCLRASLPSADMLLLLGLISREQKLLRCVGQNSRPRQLVLEPCGWSVGHVAVPLCHLCWTQQPARMQQELLPCGSQPFATTFAARTGWMLLCSAHRLDAALQPVRLVVCVVGFVPCARGLAVE